MEFSGMNWVNFLVRSINYGYANCLLSSSQRFGVITIIPKEDKPRYILTNRRPITSLNVSYKIASACITSCINSVLPKLISSNQNGF